MVFAVFQVGTTSQTNKTAIHLTNCARKTNTVSKFDIYCFTPNLVQHILLDAKNKEEEENEEDE